MSFEDTPALICTSWIMIAIRNEGFLIVDRDKTLWGVVFYRGHEEMIAIVIVDRGRDEEW